MFEAELAEFVGAPRLSFLLRVQRPTWGRRRPFTHGPGFRWWCPRVIRNRPCDARPAVAGPVVVAHPHRDATPWDAALESADEGARVVQSQTDIGLFSAPNATFGPVIADSSDARHVRDMARYSSSNEAHGLACLAPAWPFVDAHTCRACRCTKPRLCDEPRLVPKALRRQAGWCSLAGLPVAAHTVNRVPPSPCRSSRTKQSGGPGAGGGPAPPYAALLFPERPIRGVANPCDDGPEVLTRPNVGQPPTPALPEVTHQRGGPELRSASVILAILRWRLPRRPRAPGRRRDGGALFPSGADVAPQVNVSAPAV